MKQILADITSVLDELNVAVARIGADKAITAGIDRQVQAVRTAVQRLDDDAGLPLWKVEATVTTQHPYEDPRSETVTHVIGAAREDDLRGALARAYGRMVTSVDIHAAERLTPAADL